MARRVVITVTVQDDADLDVNAIADILPWPLSDPNVWEWDDFWLDAKDGVVGPDGDKTAEEST